MSTVEDRPQPPRRRLVRTRGGRLIGGVCSGLGAHFSVDPILFRIAFVGLAIFGGVGFGIYVAILLLVPEEGAARPPIHLGRSSWLSILGIVVLVVAAGVALDLVSHAALGGGWGAGVALGWVLLVGLAAAAIWTRARGGGERDRESADLRLLRHLAFATVVAVGVALVLVAGVWLAGIERQLAAWIVVALGVVLIGAAFTGRRWIMAPALTFALAVAATAAARVDLHGGVGDRSYRPTTMSELRHGYRLGAGRLEVDLRRLAFPAGQTTLHVRLGAGELVVLVPDRVCVATRARIGGGYVGALDRESGGLDLDWRNRAPRRSPVPLLVLDGRIGLGALFVADRPVDGNSGGFRVGDFGTNSACRSPAGGRA